MKVKVNIDIIDDEHDIEWHEQQGFTKSDIETLYRICFNSLLLQITNDNEVRYELNIEVED